MVIECKGCLKKFNLDEKLLKPHGSRVRCSKCGEIFRAFPGENGNRRESAAGIDHHGRISEKRKGTTFRLEKRKHPRIPISIPAMCHNMDPEGKLLDLSIGVIKEVSQTGVAMELFSSSVSGVVALSFVDVHNKDVQISAKVVHSKINPSGKMRLGLSLMGSPGEIQHFVTQAVRAHHQSGNDPGKVFIESSDSNNKCGSASMISTQSVGSNF